MELLKNINIPADIKKLELKDLPVLAQEVREKIIEVLSRNGGHLASSLGVVDLTIALLYIFDLPKDKIVWDVGHQAYAHKILTGRKDQFHTLRTFGGISGFPKPEESEYDAFAVGHSSTSISAALGMAKARDLKGEDNKVVAVLGDGALTGGLAYEGFNNAGRIEKKFLVVLNDNEMSISPNVGAISVYLNKIISSNLYNRVKKDIELILDKIPSIGHNLAKAAMRLEESVKSFLVPGILFEELGFTYFGPVDGHNIEALVDLLKSIRTLEKPAILHVLTKKGKGYSFAEQHPENYHGTQAFNIENGETNVSKTNKSFTAVFSEKVVELAEKDKNIVAITAAMSHGTGLEAFRKRYPERFFDVGIAEQHAVTFAGGLASQGLKPIVAIYSTFLQRAYDQVVHDIALQKLNVSLVLDRAGIVGEDGPTHHGLFDIAYLRHIPNLVLMQPKDEMEFKSMLDFSLNIKGPTAIRCPRGDVPAKEGFNAKPFQKIELGKSELLKEGKDAYILALGSMCADANKTSAELEARGFSVGVLNIRFIKPLDVVAIKSICFSVKKIITLEDHIITAGVGSAVLELLNQEKIKEVSVLQLGWPEAFIEHGDTDSLKKKHKLSLEDIIERTEDFIKN